MKMQTFDPDGKTNRMSMTMVPLMFPWLPERHINAQKNFAPSGLLHLHHQFCRHALGWEWLSKFLASWCLLSLVSVQANANFKKRTWYAQLAGVAAVNLFVFSNKHRQVQRAATPRTALHVNHSKSLLIATFGGFPKMGGSPNHPKS